jgi:hypothetical protein
MATYKGECFCGSVQLVVTGDPNWKVVSFKALLLFSDGLLAA